ncbi:MAG: HPr kinase/phosphatase C-terminal domain-containing protein [Novosphingobium sp.]|nr:HPr kinase/phosphatase C-terminal domain-containing protein [Novosphingobium sp.]MCP5402787.1 HPr kinase/phosphatase C-terminal domain-containing protein [Novosphingobium sp.]
MGGRVVLALQASCVAIGERGLLIEGPPGSGKSGLALALIDRGAVLVGDDSLMVEADAGRLVARPHPQTRGLLEVRNLGLVRMPVCEQVPVSLVVRLDEAAARYIEEPDTALIEAVPIPLVRLWPESQSLVLKAELALERFGLAAR